jgi:hypothetical protein
MNPSRSSDKRKSDTADTNAPGTLWQRTGNRASVVTDQYQHDLKNFATRQKYIDAMTNSAALLGIVNYVPPPMPVRYQTAMDLLGQAVADDSAEAQVLAKEEKEQRERLMSLRDGAFSLGSVGSVGSIGSPIDMPNWDWHTTPDIVADRIFGGHGLGLDASESLGYDSLESDQFLDVGPSLVETFSAHLKLDDDGLDTTDPTETSASM